MLKMDQTRVRNIADELDGLAVKQLGYAKDFYETQEGTLPNVVKEGSKPDCVSASMNAADRAVDVCYEYRKTVEAIAESIHNAATELERQDTQAAQQLASGVWIK